MSRHLLPRDQDLRPQLPAGTTVKVVGLGGVGSIVARYGAVFLAAQASDPRLVLVDGDTFEPSNATRMLFGEYGNKAAVLRAELLERVNQSGLSLHAVEEYVTPGNITRLINEGDICLLCVDNHATRSLVNRHCATLSDTCLISGGNDGVGPDAAGTFRRGTFGNVQIFVRRAGVNVTAPLTHLHPEIAHPTDTLPTGMNCTELITSVPQVLFANLTAAAAMLNTLWLHLSGALHYGELAFDIADALMRPVALGCAAGADTKICIAPTKLLPSGLCHNAPTS